MAKLRVTGKRFSINGMFGITMIAIAVVAIVTIVVAAIVLPQYAEVEDYETPKVIGIVTPDQGLISIGADLSQVFATVKYSDGSTSQVPLSELVVTGLDTSAEGTVDGVVLDFGGFKQTVSFNVVPTELKVEYVASTGGRIEGQTIQNVTAGADATRVEAIADEGYYFAGWSDGYVNASRLDTQVSKSMRLIAVFEKLRYTVVFFYPDGTTAREQEVAYNEAPLSVPTANETNMELYGYKFFGWDTDFTHITKDTNIYPIYEKYATDFQVEFTCDRSGRPLGTIKDLKSYYEKGEEANVRITANPDRKFIGWSVFNVDLQTWINLDPVMPEGRFIAVAPNSPISFISTRTGTSEEYVLSFTPEENVDEILVKAHFVYLESEISFTSMNNQAHDSFLISYDTPIGEKFNVEDLTYLDTIGYSFKGWYVNGGEVNADGTPVLVNNQTTFAQPTELIAYWEKEIFTAVFLKGGNEDPSFADVSAGYDEELGGRVVTAYYQDSLAGALTGAFPEIAPIKENYTFKGWYLADADKLPTSKVVDKTFKLESPVSYFVPVFEVNTKNLTVVINGSGSIYSLVRDEQYGVDVENSISGIVAMPVTEQYRIRIRPSEGYVLSSVDVNGAESSGSNLAIDGYYDVYIGRALGDGEYLIESDYVIKATFKLTSYVVSVANGTQFTTSGHLTYSVLGGDETLKNETDELTPAIDVNYGSGLSLEIVPERGYFISQIALNGVQLNVPEESVYYNLVLENVTSQNSVVINYERFVYYVITPEEVEGGSLTAVENLGGKYSEGDVAHFTAKALDGYYVRRVTANGTIIDPYIPMSGYTVTDVEVNGSATLVEGANDYRVTSMLITIEGVSQDVDFEVEFAPMYYNVTTSYEGIGNVTAPFTIGYNKPFHVKAETSSGYYVYSVIVNGEETTFADASLAREFSETAAKQDYDVKFVFKKTTYFVRFYDAEGTSSVSFNGKNIDLQNGVGHTENDVLHASTQEYLITADEGYFINSITVKPNAGLEYAEVVNYFATSHLVTLNNVSTSFEITIECVKTTFEYNLYFINKGSNTISVNNQSVQESYNSTIAYGNDLTMEFRLAKNNSVLVENVVIKNKDARETYEYLPLLGEYVSNPNNGYYAIIADKSNSSNFSLNVYDVKTAFDVFVTFTTQESGSNTFNYSFSGNGTLTATDTALNVINSGDALVEGMKVILTATPDSGNELRSLVVNGKEVVVEDGSYSLIVSGDVNAYAVFSETKYTISVQSGIMNGVVATDKSMVERGTSFNVKLTPVEGYKIDTFAISVEGSGVTYQPLNNVDYATGTFEYAFPASQVTGNVTINATFAPLQYLLTYSRNEYGTLGGVGDAGEVDVFYGETKQIDLSAVNGYYISEIILNGESISTQTLIGTPIVSGEYVSGILQVYVTGNVDLKVTFSPMVYTIVVNESLGGTTLVKKDGSAFLPASDLKLSAGDTLWIKMSANEGYHIEELRVNGIIDDGWKGDNVSVNDQNEKYYELGTVSGNVTLRVIYAINEYQIKVNVSNQSPNFASVDVDAQNYGTVTITGYNPGENNLYTGFTHGSNVKFVVTPRTARGYYVAKFELQYFNEEGQAINQIIGSFNENGGSYILYGISHDIQAVNVVFKRRAYSYEGFKTIENLGSSWMSTGDIVATFTNPYSNQPIVVENGLYEYGLNFTINVNPGVGYSRSLFTINGEDRLESVRNNNYVGTVTGAMSVDVVYTINTYNVSMLGSIGGTYAVYSLDNVLLWAPGIEIVDDEYSIAEGENMTYQRRVLATGTVWATSEGLTATYGTELNFSAMPDYDNGYKTNGFYVNKRASAISNENGEMRVRERIISHVDVEISFTIHTYTITVNTFEGGVATISTSVVEWHDSVTIRLVINRGYVMDAVLLNGEVNADATDALENRGVYTVNSIVNDVAFEIRLANKQYDVTFSGDYNKEYEIRQDGVITKHLTAVSGVIVNQGSLLKEEKAYYTSDMPHSFDVNGKLISTGDNNENLNRTVYADKLTVVFNVPNGYKITAVSITMDNDGGVVSNLVLGESGLDADDGSGVRTYTIPSIKGNVKIHVEYAIKTYEVEYVQRSGGSYVSTGTTLVSHHELFTIDMVSDEGFFLANLVINGRNIPTVNTKDGMRYRYTTDVQGVNGLTRLEINDELVNGEEKITVMPTYDKQRYSVIFFINNLQITSFYQDATLGVSLENNEVIYDASIPNVIEHNLQAGYSIKSIVLYSVPINDATAITNKYELALEGSVGRDYNLFTEKGEKAEITLDAALLNILDYHSNNKNVLRIYYRTEKDVHTSTGSMYLVEAEGAFNVGKSVTSSEVPKIYNRPVFSVTSSFSDFKTSDAHEYNTEATYTVKIDVNAINLYSFQGYQENIGGEWAYVENGVNGITLQSNGQVLRYTMTADREFRAVFFRTYEVTVQIHPEYKYTEGSFATTDPSRMKYRQYASLTATATYQERGNGVILPNVKSTQEILEDVDGVEDATYTFRVLSGARLLLRGNDGISVNSTKGYSYSVITYNGNKLVQREDSYALGVETLEDRLVYAYFNNVMYVSFAMETVGSSTSGAGGRVSYAVNGATVSNLSNNSLTMSPNQTLTITITPNSSYRFDSVMELLPLSEPDSQGFRQFSSTYTPLKATEDGTVEIVYYNENGAVITGNVSAYEGRISRAVVTVNGLNENAIFKIRFWKQVKVSKSISLVTDEMNGQEGGPEYKIAYTANSANTTTGTGAERQDYAIYDYNDELFFNLMFDLDEEEFSDLKRYYQFVGYFINGVNAYTQLVQNYPSTYEGRFVINDLEGLSNGVTIVENSYVQSGVSYTDYIVNVVARFIPVYNVVIENEYLDNGNYLDPGPITATTITYDEDLTQYYLTSNSVEPKLGANDTYNTDIHFQMLGKINTANAGDKSSSSSPYNVWGDNMLTLSWAGANGTGDNFAFIAWQYYAYTGSGFEWRNIPYVDPNSQTNLVTKPDFTFPISSLFSTSYVAYLSNTGVVGEQGFTYNASTYDAAGEFNGSIPMYAIRIRPLFQKVESLELVKSTALNDASIFLDGKGDVDPKIGSISRSSGNFNYYTVQTLQPAAPSGYEFAGWYITENGQGGHQALVQQATESDNNGTPVVQGENTYYFKTEVITDLNGNPTERKITYSYNPANGQMQVLMDDSFKIYARYIRIYTIRIKVTNLSGISPALQESMPTINYYKKVDGNWVLQGELSGERLIEINDARVGEQLRFTLSTNYSGNVNDSTNFNPLFDRFVNVTSVNENNLNVWDQNGSLDAQNSTIPDLLKQGLQERDLSSMDAYNDAIEGVEILVSANAEKTINVNFRSYGVLNLHNVYVGSSIKLPNALGEALYKQDHDSVELGSDVMGNDAYFVKDGGIGDGYENGVKDGVISIVDIPITTSMAFDGEDKGDYATRLLDNANVLESDTISIGINYDGSSITKKVQNVVYYGTKSYEEYVWENATLETKTQTATSLYDYPFADGGNASLAGDGTESNPFRIASVNHLRNVDSLYKGNNGTLVYGTQGGQAMRIHFIQIADVNLTETNNSFDTPIAGSFTADNGVTYTNGFNGVYDGGNHVLYNLQLNNTGIYENVGIFAKIYRGGVVKNLKLGNSYVYSTATNVGILAGQVFGGTISNVTTVVMGSENIQMTVTGSNFVGGLVGLLGGESDQEGLITGSSISGYTITASMGGSYLGIGADFTGGAGGLVGSIQRRGRVYGSDNYTNSDYYTTSGVTVQTGTSYGAEGIGAGGIAGTIQFNPSDEGVSIENVVAVNAGLSASNNNVAIGGIAGAIGANNIVQNVIHRVTAPMTIRSKSAVEGFTAPNSTADRGNFHLYGGGGIAGYNNGKIMGAQVKTESTFRLTINGSMVGGIVGVNFGTVDSSSVQARIFTSRQRSTSYEGGAYGGMIGFNVGTISNSSISGTKTATNDYDSTSAAYELTTGSEAYVPTSGANGGMHGDAGKDTTNIYVGGVVGYNEGTISAVTNNSKLMVNKRSNDSISNYSYVGAIAGSSTNSNISASGTAIIKYFHYLWVDPASGEDVENPMTAYIGNGSGNKSIGGCTVTATAEYVGGGSIFTPASDEVKWGDVAASGYLKGSASVYFYSINSSSAYSYVTRNWNDEGAISAAQGETGKAYANAQDCYYTKADISIWGAWNYYGTLRFVSVTAGNY